MLKREGIKALFFDFDGVVVQSEHIYDQSTRQLGEYFNVNIPSSFYGQNRGISEALFYQRFRKTFNMDIKAEELEKVGRKILWKNFQSAVSYTPGFESFYNSIKNYHWHIGLVTATPRRLIEQIFHTSNLEVKFDGMITGDEVDTPKPDPDPYVKMCQVFHVVPEAALVIEDSPPGIRSAVGAGCYTIGLTTTCARDSLNEAHLIVDSFAELEELLTSGGDEG